VSTKYSSVLHYAVAEDLLSFNFIIGLILKTNTNDTLVGYSVCSKHYANKAARATSAVIN
jgi:hypothetical protein